MDISNQPVLPSKNSGIKYKRVPFADVIPLGLGSSGAYDLFKKLSLSDFVDKDIESVLPGLLPQDKTHGSDSDLFSFTEFALKGILDAYEDVGGYSLLSLVQLRTLGSGKCVSEEVADMVLNL